MEWPNEVLGGPGERGGVRPRSKVYRLNYERPRGTPFTVMPPPVGFVTRPMRLVDSIAGLQWQPRTVYLTSTTIQLNTPDSWPNVKEWVSDPAGDVSGFMTVELRGVHGGGYWFRRFDLRPFQQVAIPMETLDDIAISLISCTAVNFDLCAIATERVLQSDKPADIFLAQIDVATGIGTFTTPPGAVQLIPEQDAPDFFWRVSESIAIPVPLFAGVPVPVVAGAYIPQLASFAASWRISL